MIRDIVLRISIRSSLFFFVFLLSDEGKIFAEESR